jgi:hypothetical protein
MTQDSENYMDLPTESEIPWTQTADLGAGVAAPGGELLQSAVERFTVVPGENQDEDVYVQIVESSQDIKKLVSIDVRAGFNKAAVSASAHTKFADNLSVSDHSSTVVYFGKILWGAAFASPLPHLTAEALKLYKKNPKEFHRAHGHYFIAGFTKEAKLSIFAHVTGQERTSVRSIAADVNATFKNPDFGAKGDLATNLENSAKKSNCLIELNILKTGVSGKGSEENLNIPMSEAQKHFKDFKERAIGTKAKALLVHYMRVEPTISTKVVVDPDMFNTANRFYEDLILARVLRKRLPKHYAEQNMEQKFKDIEDDNLKYIPRDLSGDIEKLRELRKRIQKWVYDADELEKYRHLWQKAERASSEMFKWGVNPWEDPELAGLDIAVNSNNIRRGYILERDGLAYLTGSLTIKVEPNRTICGIELRPNKSHHGNFGLVDGGLKKDLVIFKFKSEYCRGFNWRATVWSVPKDMSLFEINEL